MSNAMLETRGRQQAGGLLMSVAAAPPRGGVVTAGGAPEVAGGDALDQPSSRRFIAMLEAYRATGGMAPGNFLCQSLQQHQRGELGQLARLVEDRRLFVLDWRGDSWIPMFQFDADDLSCKAGPALVRAELAGLDSGWAIASWFARPNAQLEGRLPVDIVDLDLGAVVDAARYRGTALAPQHRLLEHA
jgi:hypothetical protein